MRGREFPCCRPVFFSETGNDLSACFLIFPPDAICTAIMFFRKIDIPVFCAKNHPKVWFSR
ncbi:hypothetical protein [Azospirillum palustre]